MVVREITQKEKRAYDRVVYHVIQSWEWGEFRKKTGVEVVRLGEYEGKTLKRAYQFTIHSVPLIKQGKRFLRWQWQRLSTEGFVAPLKAHLRSR